MGSLFYGSLLGCFVLAFLFPRVRGTAVFCGMLAGEAAIFATAYYTDVSWLWYNVIGCGMVVGVALGITYATPGTPEAVGIARSSGAGNLACSRLF